MMQCGHPHRKSVAFCATQTCIPFKINNYAIIGSDTIANRAITFTIFSFRTSTFEENGDVLESGKLHMEFQWVCHAPDKCNTTSSLFSSFYDVMCFAFEILTHSSRLCLLQHVCFVIQSKWKLNFGKDE